MPLRLQISIAFFYAVVKVFLRFLLINKERLPRNEREHLIRIWIRFYQKKNATFIKWRGLPLFQLLFDGMIR